MQKMKLDLDTLEIASFETMAAERGAATARDAIVIWTGFGTGGGFGGGGSGSGW